MQSTGSTLPPGACRVNSVWKNYSSHFDKVCVQLCTSAASQVQLIREPVHAAVFRCMCNKSVLAVGWVILRQTASLTSNSDNAGSSSRCSTDVQPHSSHSITSPQLPAWLTAVRTRKAVTVPVIAMGKSLSVYCFAHPMHYASISKSHIYVLHVHTVASTS